MIVDNIANIMFYHSLVQHLAAGMAAVEALGGNLEVGRFEFDGGYFMVQKGSTKPMTEGTFEAHRKYVDVQMIVEGSEEVAWAGLRNLHTEIPYDPEKDAERLSGSLEHVMKMSAGMFYIAFPHDGHKPVSHIEEQQSYTKIVMKLPV